MVHAQLYNKDNIARQKNRKDSVPFSRTYSVGGPSAIPDQHADGIADTLWYTRAPAPLVQRKCAECQGELAQQVSGQPPLNVGPANDVYEREADAIARRVMAMNSVSLHEVGKKRSMPRREIGSEDGAVRVHRDPDVDGSIQTTRVRRPNQTGVVDFSATPLTRGGNPLPDATRQFFESRMGRDLSSVRLHCGNQSNQLNDEIGAKAFAFRNHIWLGGDVGPSPSFSLAHELAHVVQQTSPDEGGVFSTLAAPPSIQRLLPPGDCEQIEHDTLQRKVKEFCDPPPYWPGGTTAQTWRQCRENDSCGQLKKKITRNQMCALSRRTINDKCYRGGDKGHRKAEQHARRGQASAWRFTVRNARRSPRLRIRFPFRHRARPRGAWESRA